MCVSMPGIVYTNYRQSLVITGGRLLRWKNCERIDTMPDNSVSASDIRRSKIVALTQCPFDSTYFSQRFDQSILFWVTG